MGEAEAFDKALKDLNELLKEVNSIKVINNIKFLVKDYIEDQEKQSKRAIS